MSRLIHRRRPWWFIWVVSFGIWTLIALTQVVTRFEYARLMGLTFTRYLAVVPLVRYWISALLTPFVFRLALKHPIEKSRWYRQCAAYLLGGLAFTITQETIRVLVYPVREMPGISLAVFEHLFLYCLAEDIFQIYLPIVVFAQTVAYYRRMKDREVQLARARLQALKAKLHPHFLFNAMHSISAMMFHDVAAADKMMSRLSDLLRLMFENEDTQETTLRKELELLDLYLQLEKVRFNDRLEVFVEPDPSTLEAGVPYFLFQPLVENALRHGISNRSNDGRIWIRSRRLGATLQLTVTDNGPGLTDGNAAEPRRDRLGLATTHKRLQALYGNAQSLTITNVPAGGIEVKVEIPFQAMSDESEAHDLMGEAVEYESHHR